MTTSARPYRVIQWGTGAVARELLEPILDRADLQLVGVRVYTEAKNGVDAGALVDRAATGVIATTDVDALLRLDADCVLYTPRFASVDEICAILASGKNVVTTAFLFHPDGRSAPDRDRILAACRAGGTSIHGGGINPGILTLALPLTLSAMSRRIERISLQERADWTLYESPHITFDGMRFGAPVDEITPTTGDYLPFLSSLFIESVWFLSDALYAGIDDVTVSVDAVPAAADHDIFGRTLKAGSTAGQHWLWRGLRDGETLIEFETLWTVGGEYPKHWPTPKDGWTLNIEGDPSMRNHFFSLASFTKPKSLEEHVRSANVAAAMPILHALPAVCAAPPGFATSATLPLIRTHIGFGHFDTVG